MASDFEGRPPAVSAAEAALPVQLGIPYPERLSRLLLFVKWLLVIPLYVLLNFWGIAVGVVFVIAFFAILFVGRYPRSLFDFTVEYYRFYYRVLAYFPLLLVDKWWPDDGHPLRFEVEYPERLSRGILLLKLVSLLLGVVDNIAGAAVLAVFLFALPAWFIILFTGRYTREMYDVAVMILRWAARVTSWQYLLRDEWSLFGTTRAVKVLVIVGIAIYFLCILLYFVALAFMVLVNVY